MQAAAGERTSRIQEGWGDQRRLWGPGGQAAAGQGGQRLGS